ncbi:hypothetical protein OF83DRAFT_1136847 [Amylostereum chailletii]|nr:hypothetical protein OF83DRAFT_1136847 [Amylostereum chailletii]
MPYNQYAPPPPPPPSTKEKAKPMQTDTSTAQFSLIKNWLQHIRLFLRRSEGSPTVVWDELMRIRLTGWYVDAGTKACRRRMGELQGEDAEEHGLLGFFEEKLKI